MWKQYDQLLTMLIQKVRDYGKDIKKRKGRRRRRKEEEEEEKEGGGRGG